MLRFLFDWGIVAQPMCWPGCFGPCFCGLFVSAIFVFAQIAERLQEPSDSKEPRFVIYMIVATISAYVFVLGSGALYQLPRVMREHNSNDD